MAGEDQDFIDANTIFDEGHEDDLAMCCGLDAHGHCQNIGTEWCDWKCPFNHEATHNNSRKRRERSAPLLDVLAEALAKGAPDGR